MSIIRYIMNGFMTLMDFGLKRLRGGDGKLELVVQSGHANAVISVVLSANGRFVATGGSGDRTAILWNAATGKKLRTFCHSEEVRSVSLTADGSRLVTGSSDDTAILWNAATGEKIRTFVGHEEWVESVALSANGALIVTGSGDNTAILWNAATGEKIRTFAGHTDNIQGIWLSADSNLMATGSSDEDRHPLERGDGARKSELLPGTPAGF